MKGVSILTKLVMKVFKWFGINGILTLVFLAEIFACLAFVSEKSTDEEAIYEFANVESVEKLDYDDERLAWQGIDGWDDVNYYLVGLRIDNFYSKDLYYHHLGAEDQDGNYVTCTRYQYYGRDTSQYSIYEYVPAGTSSVLYYFIEIRDYKADSVESIRLFDYNATDGGKKKGTGKEITFALPQ